MKEIKYIRFISLFTIALFLICAGDVVFAGDSTFRILRGVNISHWLSQSQRRGQPRQEFFTKKDVAYIAWANWDYKGGFGIVGRDDRPDEEMIRALIPK